MDLGDEDEDDEKVRTCAGCLFFRFFVDSAFSVSQVPVCDLCFHFVNLFIQYQI